MTDVHATTDGIVVMFHDPTLDRTTDGKGAIKEQAWVGNIEYVLSPLGTAAQRRVLNIHV